MKTTWYKGMDERQKDEIISAFRASGRLRSRLHEILNDKINEMQAKRRSESGYESPNWSFRQADYAGYERAMHEIISLIESESISSKE